MDEIGGGVFDTWGGADEVLFNAASITYSLILSIETIRYLEGIASITYRSY